MFELELAEKFSEPNAAREIDGNVTSESWLRHDAVAKYGRQRLGKTMQLTSYLNPLTTK